MPCATCRANHSTLSFPCLCVAPSQLSLRYSAVPLRYSAVLCGTHVSTGSAEEEGVHRTLSDGSVVRATAIESVTRDESGRLSLRLKGLPTKLSVSRLYAHLFKAM